MRTSARVRRHAGSAAFAAALLLYFGFAYLAKPDVTDFFTRVWLVLYYTVRVGGVAMAVVAAWLWTGSRFALAADAAVAVPVGAILMLTGLGMFSTGVGSLQPFINIVCGWMFFSSGLRNGREYLALRALNRQAVNRLPTTSAPSPVTESIGQAEMDIESGTPQGDGPAESAVTTGESQAPPTPEPPPPGGYLASFAKKPPGERDV